MALKINPLTGQYEDDGLPEDPNALPPMPGVGPENLQAVNDNGGGGSTPAPSGGLTIPAGTSLFPAPPAREVQITRQTPIESKQELNALGRVKAADASVSKAIDSEAQIAGKEAQIEADRSKGVTEHLEDRSVTDWELEQQEKRELEARSTRERSLAEDAAKKKIRAGAARAEFWKGNPIGEVIAALVTSLAAGVQAYEGKDGLTPAERILQERIENHERALLAEWEASKEARDLFRADRTAWEAERARRRVLAANQSQHDLAILNATADRSLKALGKDKAAAGATLKKALEEKANALTELKRTEGLRALRKYEETRREQPESDGWTDKPLTEAEAKSNAYGSTIIEAMDRSGDIVLKPETVRTFQANVRQLQKESPGVVTNFLRKEGFHPAPDDFFDGIEDPKQRQAIRDWANAANAQIRQESGAAIPTFEQLNNAYRNVPTAASSPEEQRRLRDDMLKFGQKVLPRKAQAKPYFEQAETAKQRWADPQPKTGGAAKPQFEEGEEFTYEGVRYIYRDGKPERVR